MQNLITVDTKLVAILGTPLAHSFSFRMQNAAYAAMGIDYFYLPVEVGNENLGKVVEAIRVMNFAGFALTTPNKVAVMQYLDEVDEAASMMGSVNTVVVKGGKLKGYNTDGYGALRSIREEAGSIAGKVFFSFGAGGTGRSVCLELAEAGAKRIFLCSRSATCEALAAHINKFFPGVCVAVRAAETEQVAEALKASNVVLNLSGSGMAGHEGETPVDKKFLLPGHICFDATYNPGKTRFLQDAESLGCKTINGLGMVLYQGARQIALWTGRDEDEAVPAMRRSLMEIAGKK